MKVLIKNKLISLGGSSEVKREDGSTIFTVQGKIISPTKKKFIYDEKGKLLYVIRNKWFNFFTNRVYIFDANNTRLATIKKGKFSLNFKYTFEDCTDAYEIQGKFFSRESKILKNGEVAATITKEFTLMNDAFTLEAEESDVPFMTAIVVAFDNLIDKIQDEN